MVIVIGGMIGLGKTTTTKILSDAFQIPAFFESVEDNKVLSLFYNATDAENEKYRYPFLLQLNFLSSRYHSIKQALRFDNAILDRSIYEDLYFATKNFELGRISELEMEIYRKLLLEMMDSLHSLPRKTPDVMVYLTGSFDTVLKRIMERGRSFEIDPELKEYYRFLWKNYDDFIRENYRESPVIFVDVDSRDIKYNEEDRKWLIEEIKKVIDPR